MTNIYSIHGFLTASLLVICSFAHIKVRGRRLQRGSVRTHRRAPPFLPSARAAAEESSIVRDARRAGDVLQGCGDRPTAALAGACACG
eukprot:3982602-Prymnesium_polylepis.2